MTDAEVRERIAADERERLGFPPLDVEAFERLRARLAAENEALIFDHAFRPHDVWVRDECDAKTDDEGRRRHCGRRRAEHAS